MTQAPRDQNYVTALMGVSSADMVTPTPVAVDPITHRVLTSPSGGTAVVRETPSGLVNGSNVTFTLAHTPSTGTENVYLNGLLQDSGANNDYTISGATITFNQAPQTGDKIRVNYSY